MNTRRQQTRSFRFGLRARSSVLAVMCAVTGASLVATGPASAAVTTTFQVTVNVLQACAVSAGNLDFGSYSSGTAAPVLGSANISVTCALLTPYTVSLNNGANASGSTRRMASGANRLTYELYQTSARTTIFGAVASVLNVSGVGTGSAFTHTVYGTIAAGQSASTGAYADTITVTVDY